MNRKSVLGAVFTNNESAVFTTAESLQMSKVWPICFVTFSEIDAERFLVTVLSSMLPLRNASNPFGK